MKFSVKGILFLCFGWKLIPLRPTVRTVVPGGPVDLSAGSAVYLPYSRRLLCMEVFCLCRAHRAAQKEKNIGARFGLPCCRRDCN